MEIKDRLEPVLAGASYGETKTDRAGRAWGVARTRRPAAPLADYDAAVDHLLEQARRAVQVLRATVEELALRDDRGRPAGVADCIYESRGDVILMTDPAAAARRFRDRSSTWQSARASARAGSESWNRVT